MENEENLYRLLPKIDDLEHHFSNITYLYNKFLEGDCDPKIDEMQDLLSIESDLKALADKMRRIYDEH